MTERAAGRPVDMERIRALVHEFATCAAAQTDVFWAENDAEKCNAYADRVLAAFKGLCEYGDAGRDALASLFAHTRADVRTLAAAFLLRHRHAEARAVLEEEAGGKGLTAFEAGECLKRWEEGAWQLDPG